MLLEKRSTIAFLEALKSSVWNKDLKMEVFEGLTHSDWLEIFHLSFEQTVEGHIAESIQKLDQSLLPSQDLYLKWMVRLQRIEDKNKEMERVIGKMFKLFQKNGIKAYLQKGHGVSHYYENPKVRVSGDIDWFFPTIQDFEKANTFMNYYGRDFKIQTTFSSGYTFDGIEIEHHIKLIQLRNPFVMKYVKALVSNYSNDNILLRFSDCSVEVPSPMLNVLQVNAHILKHQISYGIRLRQIIDSARLYHHFGHSLDGRLIKNIYDKLGMLSWAHSFHKVMVELLNFPVESLPFPIENHRDVTWMKEYIIKTGNFGFYDPEHPDILNPGGRVDREVRLFDSFKHFFPLAPMETACFPFVQIYSKIFR